MTTSYTADGKHPELDLKRGGGERAHKPSTIYFVDQYRYVTDRYSRPRSVQGALQLGDAKRRSSQSVVGRMGEPGDQGGHLIPKRCAGPGFALNVVPMSRDLNLSVWKKHENRWVKYLQNKESV